MNESRRNIGMAAAVLTPLFMGMTPIFGKLTLASGVDAYTMAAWRTCLAALILWVIYLLFFRQYIYIFPAGIMGTAAVGAINGLGSLLYYNGLLLLNDASLAQLLFMLYVVFTMLLTRLLGQNISFISVLRVLLALVAVYLLTTGIEGTLTSLHWIGVGLAIGGAFMYALHVVLSQRVMFEMPAQTMALYGLSFMGLAVLIVRLIFGTTYALPWVPIDPKGWWWIMGLMAVTALSRVTLFLGVRNLGSLQTMLLNTAELGVTLLLGFFWLGEVLTHRQWFGVAILVGSALLSHFDQEVRDAVYRPLIKASPFRGFSFKGPVEPDRFSTVSRVYRRKPRPTLPEQSSAED